ncbi:hypothetical protein STENM36S_03357 [Streptomyces tendae]
MTSLEAAHESWLTRVTVLEPPEPLPPASSDDDPQAASVPTMPSPTARTLTFLVMLTEFLLGDQEKTRPRPEPPTRVPGRAQQLEW